MIKTQPDQANLGCPVENFISKSKHDQYAMLFNSGKFRTLLKKYISRIEFWILILFIIRLIGITNPPLEIGHSWRQVTGLMVARNYLEVNSDILYPRVDDNEARSGIIGMEFPVLNYMHFLSAKLFGYQHWYGRLINLIVSSIALFFFYKLIPYLGLNKRTAFFSTLLLGTSIWFAFSRKTMPDTFCISLSFIGIFSAVKYLENKRSLHLILFTVFSSLAILSKLPAGIYIIPVYLLLFNRHYTLNSKIILAISSFIPFALAYYWYFIWNTHLSDEFGFWYNIGSPLRVGFNEIVRNPGKTLDNFYFNSFSGYFAFLLFLIGLFFMIKHKEKRLIMVFSVLFSVFLVYIFKSGHFFYQHNYYIIPFVPVMAVVAGYTISLIKAKWVYIAILVIAVGEGIANQQHDFFVPEKELYKLELEGIMDEISSRDDLILINGNGNPQLIYLSHRKGWNVSNESLQNATFISDKIEKGCKFIVINKHTAGELMLPYHLEFASDDFLVYRTDPG